MKRRLLSLLLLICAVATTGCVRSLYPIYTEKTLTYDPAFLGTWLDQKEETRLEIAAASDNDEPGAIKSYRVTHTDKDAKPARLIGHLAKVGDLLVADLMLADENELPGSEFAKSHLFPLHTFWIVRHDDAETMTIRAIDDDWMKKFANDHPAAIAHYKSKDEVILTAPPEELQKFLLAHEKDEGMLSDAEHFHRAKPGVATAPPPKTATPSATPKP
jgi:hypothetical protein